MNVWGLTFKEGCADLRNSKVVDIIGELRVYGVEVFVHDPEADSDEALREYGLSLRSWQDLPRADAVIAAVAHKQFRKLAVEVIARKVVKNGCFIPSLPPSQFVDLEPAGLLSRRSGRRRCLSRNRD